MSRSRGDALDQCAGHRAAFELPFSGWYWQITRLDHDPPEIRTSRSLFGSQPQFGDDSGGRDVVSGYLAGPGEKPLRMLQRKIDAGDDGRFLVQVAANAEVIQTQIARFEYALAATFLALALALIGSTALAVRFGLRPLRELRRASPRSGAARPNASPARFRRTSRRSPRRSTCCSIPTATSSSAPAPRSAISPTHSRRRSA